MFEHEGVLPAVLVQTTQLSVHRVQPANCAWTGASAFGAFPAGAEVPSGGRGAFASSATATAGPASKTSPIIIIIIMMFRMDFTPGQQIGNRLGSVPWWLIGRSAEIRTRDPQSPRLVR